MQVTREMWIHRLASDSDNLPLHGEFADWLDIHGDNERAEFIRLQIGCLEARRHPQDSFQADRKADDYFEVHGPTWYEPLLRTLGYEPEQYIVRGTNRWLRRLEDGTTRQQLGGACIELDFSSKSDGSPTIARLTYEEGVVDRLMLCNPLASSKFQLGEALCLEPVRSVTLKIGGDDKPEHWQRQSHPRLDQIETLTICLDGPNFVHSSKVASAVIADPNLKNVRTLSMLAGGFGLEQLDRSLLQTLATSTLAQGLRSVSLNSIDFDGLEVLCENASFQWSELFLDGEFGPNAPSLIIKTGLHHHLETLVLGSFARLDEHLIGDHGVQAICAVPWQRLTRLAIPRQGLSFESIREIAKASFSDRIQHLDLSQNPNLFYGDHDLNVLRSLCDALNPSCLRTLDLAKTGLESVPAFLGDRFGDRVTV